MIKVINEIIKLKHLWIDHGIHQNSIQFPICTEVFNSDDATDLTAEILTMNAVTHNQL